MKGIIVIDVPVDDTTDFGHMDIRADVKVDAYNDINFKTYELPHIKVEPMPQKKKLDEDLFLSKNFELEYVRFDGYNTCIDDIIRGAEE